MIICNDHCCGVCICIFFEGQIEFNVRAFLKYIFFYLFWVDPVLKRYCLDMGFTDRYCLDMGCSNEVQTTTAHLQAAPHLYSPCPICIPSLSLCPVFIPSLRPPFSESTPSLQHKYRQCPIPAACSTTTTHFQSIHHLSCSCTVSTPSLLLISS